MFKLIRFILFDVVYLRQIRKASGIVLQGTEQCKLPKRVMCNAKITIKIKTILYSMEIYRVTKELKR